MEHAFRQGRQIFQQQTGSFTEEPLQEHQLLQSYLLAAQQVPAVVPPAPRLGTHWLRTASPVPGRSLSPAPAFSPLQVVPARSLSPLRSEPSHASYPPPASPVWVNRFPTPVPRHKVQPPQSPETVGRQTQSLQPELTHGIAAQYSTPVHPSHSQVSPIQYHRLLPRESSYTPQVRSISPQRSPQPHSQPQASFSASRVPRPVQLPSQPQPLLQEQVQQSSSDYLTQTTSIPLPISCGSNGHTIPEELPTHSNRTLPIPRQTLHPNESNTEKEQMAEMLGTLWRRTSAFAEECSRWNHALQERQKEAADLADMLHTLSKQFADSLPQENDHTHEPHEPLTSTSETTAATAAAIEQAIGLIMPSPAHLGRSRLVDHETAETEAHEAVSDFQDFQASLPSGHSIHSIHSPQAAFAQRDHSPQALLAQRDDGCENMPSVQGMTEISTMQGMDILAAQICEEEMSLEESAEYLRSVAMRLDAPGTQAQMTYEATSVIPGEDGKLAPEAYVGVELSPDPEEGELFAKVRSALSRVVGDSAAESLTDPAPTVIPGAWEERARPPPDPVSPPTASGSSVTQGEHGPSLSSESAWVHTGDDYEGMAPPTVFEEGSAEMQRIKETLLMVAPQTSPDPSLTVPPVQPVVPIASAPAETEVRPQPSRRSRVISSRPAVELPLERKGKAAPKMSRSSPKASPSMQLRKKPSDASQSDAFTPKSPKRANRSQSRTPQPKSRSPQPKAKTEVDLGSKQLRSFLRSLSRPRSKAPPMVPPPRG